MRENARLEFDKNLGCGGDSSTDALSREVIGSCEGKTHILALG